MLVNTQNVLRKTHEETIAEERNVQSCIMEYLEHRADIMAMQFLKLRDDVLCLDFPRRDSGGYHGLSAETKPI
jgi:hypothetical protein